MAGLCWHLGNRGGRLYLVKLRGYINKGDFDGPVEEVDLSHVPIIQTVFLHTGIPGSCAVLWASY